MAHYAIGDIQGCYEQLIRLLNKIHFSPETDTLWFTGDLVSRGPQSLETLRFVSQLPNVVVSLGNHDIRLLIYALTPKKTTHIPATLAAILQAPDKDKLCSWLRQQPLLYHDVKLGYTLVHAGLAPQWDLNEALACAKEVESRLRGYHYVESLNILSHYLDSHAPMCWRSDLTGDERLGCITNYLTRVRFCDKQGGLELHTKDSTHDLADQYLPWFCVKGRKSHNLNIIFGHWAALHGETGMPNVHALDTGCDHGYALTAMCLEDGKRISVSCNTSKSLSSQ